MLQICTLKWIWGHNFVKDLPLFRMLELCMTKELPACLCCAWQLPRTRCWGLRLAGFHAPVHPWPFIYHAISSMLAVFAVLFSVQEKIYACHRRKGNNMWKKILQFETTLNQKLVIFLLFPLFSLFSLSLFLIYFSCSSSSFPPHFVLQRWDYIHKGVVYRISLNV